MKRAHRFSGFVVVSVLSMGLVAAGCGRSEEPDTNASASGDMRAEAETATTAPESGQELTVTGCLTASLDGSSYALTPSDTGATAASQSMAVPGAATLTYELVGNAEDFRRHANTMVTARGRSDASAGREAEMERTDEASQPAAGSSGTPTVETKEEVEVNVRRLHVASVVGTGEACPSLGAGGGRATSAPEAQPKGGAAPRP